MLAARSRPLISAVSNRNLLESPSGTGADLLVAWAADVARAGVDLIQIRERDLDDRTLMQLVVRVLGATRGTAAEVIVNERTDVALAAGAAGVHLPGTAAPPDRVRVITPPGFLIGKSVHSVEDAVAAHTSGACDYLTFGTVFPSRSKPSNHPAAGTTALQRVVDAVSLPVLAIGGVTARTAHVVVGTGAAGIAGIGIFCDAWTTDQGHGGGQALEALVGALRAAFVQ